MTTQIRINGDEYSDVSLPASGRLFRAAWEAPVNDVIQLDVNKVAEIVHAKRREWREWKDSQPFSFDPGTGVDLFDKDRASVDRIMGLMFMSSGAQAKGSTVEAELAAMGAPGNFTSYTSTEHPINDAFVNGLFTALGVHTATVHGLNNTHKASIETHRANSDVAALQALMETLEAEMNV